jgi:hypothetical protein
MSKDAHSTLPADAELVLPERSRSRLPSWAGAARDGLLALAMGPPWGCWLACWRRMSSGWSAPGAATVSIVLRSATQPGKVTLGGRRVRVDRPRMRSADGIRELPCRPRQRLRH